MLIQLRRKSILLAAGILSAGGAVVYLKSRIGSRRRHGNGDDEALENLTGSNNNNAQTSARKKKGEGLKSLKVMTAILLSQMGKMGARDLLALVATMVEQSTYLLLPLPFSDIFFCLCHSLRTSRKTDVMLPDETQDGSVHSNSLSQAQVDALYLEEIKGSICGIGSLPIGKYSSSAQNPATQVELLKCEG